MLIFEGVDCMGKTTTALAMRQFMGDYAYQRFTKPPGGMSAYWYHGLFAANCHNRQLVDRLHWSELAYGVTYRNNPGYSLHEWRLMNLMLLAANASVVYMTDDIDQVRRRWLKRKEPYDHADLHKLMEIYDQLVVNKRYERYENPLPTVTWRYQDLFDHGEANDEVLELVAEEYHQNQVTWELLPQSIGIGGTKPGGFAIIGESQSTTQNVGDYGPRCCWDQGPAADLLWKTIDEANIDCYAGYYTNANAFITSAIGARYIVQQLKPRTVILLGNRAKNLEKELKLLDRTIQAYCFEHPSYMSRFKYRELESYVTDIQKALEPWKKNS